MTELAPPDPLLRRRHLLRGSAVLAGAAVIGTALAPERASAADGGATLLGTANAAGNRTSITVDGGTGGPDPALALNNADGPSLSLQPLPADWGGDLRVGEIANTTLGPLIGVDNGEGPEVTYLATAADLDSVPSLAPLAPTRVLDTRTTAGRASVLRTSAAALDTDGRLKAGAWMDLAVAGLVPGIQLGAAFLNLTVAKPGRNGYLTVYLPGTTRPTASTLNFTAGQNLSNAAFAALTELLGAYAVRIYASQTTHVVVDLTGVLASGAPGTGTPGAQNRSVHRRHARQAKLAQRLRPASR